MRRPRVRSVSSASVSPHFVFGFVVSLRGTVGAATRSVERADFHQVLAALIAEALLVLLEAPEDHHVALPVEFLAQALEVPRAGIVRALVAALRGAECR